MTEVPRTPWIVRIAVALTLFNTWVLFEELVVDRLGLYKNMPCYTVGRFCEWDVGAIVVIVVIVTLAFPDSRARVLSVFRRDRRP